VWTCLCKDNREHDLAITTINNEEDGDTILRCSGQHVDPCKFESEWTVTTRGIDTDENYQLTSPLSVNGHHLPIAMTTLRKVRRGTNIATMSVSMGAGFAWRTTGVLTT
jgi:hypothetical protein